MLSIVSGHRGLTTELTFLQMPKGCTGRSCADARERTLHADGQMQRPGGGRSLEFSRVTRVSEAGDEGRVRAHSFSFF